VKFTLAVHTANLAVLVGAIPLGGWMADHIGRLSLLLCCAVFTVVTAHPLWLIAAVGMEGGAWLGQCLMVAAAGLFIGGSAEIAAMAFPHGVSLCLLILIVFMPVFWHTVTSPDHALCISPTTQIETRRAARRPSPPPMRWPASSAARPPWPPSRLPAPPATRPRRRWF
jgi:hypothetical protein